MKKIYFYIRDISEYIMDIETLLKQLPYEYEFFYDLNNLIETLENRKQDETSILIMDVFLENKHKNSLLTIRRKFFLPIIIFYKEKIDNQSISDNFIYVDTYLSLDELNSLYGINIITNIIERKYDHSSKKVFIIDDSITRQKIIRSTLKKYNYMLYDSEYERNLIYTLEHVKPDIILIDMTKNQEEKLQFIKQVRISETLMKIPVLALFEESDDIDNSFELGINQIFIINQDSLPLLEAYVYKILYDLKLTNAKRVLVIDDSPSLLQGISFTLRHQGFIVDTALNVFSAMELMQKELPDVIILDISMPIMNGFQYSRFLKSDKLLRNIPIIALTGINVSKAESFYANHLGIDDYILKPFEKKKIIRSILKLKIPKLDSKLKNRYSIDFLLTRINDMLDINNFQLLIKESLNNLVKRRESLTFFWKSFFDLIGKLLYLHSCYIKLEHEYLLCFHRDNPQAIEDIQLYVNEEILKPRIYYCSDYIPQPPKINILFEKTFSTTNNTKFKIVLLGSLSENRQEIDKQIIDIINDFISYQVISIIHLYELHEKANEKNIILESLYHQIKNPVTILENFFSISTKDNYHSKDMELIKKSITQLSEMTNRISELIHIRTNKRIFNENFDPRQLIQSLLKENELKQKDKNITIITDFPAKELFIHGDKKMIKILLNELIINSLNYIDPQGKIKISIEEQVNQLLITINDNGPGIDSHDLKNIYLEFYQGLGISNNNGSHTGLGLTLAKEIAKCHDFYLKIDSEPHKGTSCILIIPKKNI